YADAPRAHPPPLSLHDALPISAVAAQSTRSCLPRIDRLEIELSLAFDEEHTVRGLIAARGVAIVPTRLQEIGPRSQPEFGLSFRGLNVGPRQDYDLHVVGVRVEWSCESRRQLEKRAKRAGRMVTPQIRNLDSRGTGVEIGPFHVAGRHDDESACRWWRSVLGCRLSGCLRQNRRRHRERHP